MADPEVEILDIAVPPHSQPVIIAEAVRHKHIRGIMAQKPLALSWTDARSCVELYERAGIVLAVNQNMRYDQSIRALKTLLERGDLGEPVLATIEMRAIPHWQSWLQEYGRLTLAAMSIHHLDCMRFLFGDPEFVYVSAHRSSHQVPAPGRNRTLHLGILQRTALLLAREPSFPESKSLSRLGMGNGQKIQLFGCRKYRNH